MHRKFRSEYSEGRERSREAQAYIAGYYIICVTVIWLTIGALRATCKNVNKITISIKDAELFIG